jgi:hypothetical protein
VRQQPPWENRTYNVTVTNSQGCTASTSTVVVVNPTPVPVVGSNSPICAGTTLNLSATGGGTYSWLGPNSFTSTSGTPSIVAATTAATGTYTVTVTSATGGCTATGTTTVTVNAVPNPAITGTLTVCAPNTTTLTASGGTSYAWAASAGGTIVGGTTSAQVIASTTGTYTVTVTANNCTATSSVAVTVNTPPTVTITPPATLCVAPATLIATGGGTYAWAAANGGTIIGSTTGASITATTTGTYNVIVTTNGCTTTASTSLTLETAPTANAGPDNTVCSGSSTYTLAATAAGVGQTGTWSVTLPAGSALGFTNVNSPTSQVVGLTPGTYTLRWTVTNNPIAVCPPAFDEMILTVLAPIDNTAPTLTCSGDNLTYTASFTISGGTAPYTVTPQAGTPTGNLVGNVFTSNPITAGTAFVYDIDDAASQCGIRTVTGNTNCTNFQCIISAGEPISQCVSAGATATVQIDASSSQLPAGSIGLWSEVTTSGATIAELNTAISDVTGLSAGTYVFRWTIEDDNGGDICAGNDEVTVNITSPAPPTADNPTYCAGAAIPASTAVGTAAATFTWYDAPTAGNVLASTASYTPTAAGTYYVSQTVGGCQSPRTAVTWTQNAPTPTVSGNSPICSNGSATLSVNQIYSSYQWSNGGGTSQSATYANVTANTTYTVLVTDANNCSNTANYTVTVTSAPAPSITPNVAVCAGQSATYSIASVSVTGATYTWTVNNGNITAGQGTNSVTVTWGNAPSGTIAVSVTAAGCTGTDSETITINPIPVATLTNTGPVCAGASVSLTALPSGASYQWAGTGTSGITSTQTINPAVAGNYTVTVTDANTCSSSASTTVAINPNPTPSIINGAAQNICDVAGSTLSLTAIGGTSYEWATADGTISGSATSQTITATAAGTYIVTVTLNACASTTQVVVTANSSACSVPVCTTSVTTASAGTDASQCESVGTYALNGNIPSTGTGAWSILSQPAGASASIANLSLANSGVTGLTVAGDYNFAWTITSSNPACPPSIDYVKVTVNPNPVASISGNTDVCAGLATTLTASGGTSYAWNTTETMAAITTSTAGTYTVTVTANGCTDVATTTVTVNPLPTAAITPNSPVVVCQGDDITLTATGGTNYVWTLANATTQAGNPLIIANATTANAGNYTVTATDANGCTDTEQVAVTVNAIPAAPVAVGGTFCTIADITQITATGAATATFTWYSDANLTTIIDTDATYTPTAAGSVYVTQTVNGCQSPATTVTTTISGTPNAPIANGATYCAGDNPAALTVLNPVAGATITWYSDAALTAQVGTGTSFDAGTTISTTTTYYVTQTIGTCVSPATPVTITVNAIPAAPNATSPAPYCQGDAIAAITATGNVGATFTWYSDAALTTIINNTASYTPSASGVFYVTQTLNGCPSVATQVDVVINPLPNAAILGNSLVCTDAGATTALTATGGTSYLWNTGETTAAVDKGAGTYTVTVTDANGCTKSATVTVVATSTACDPGVNVSGSVFNETVSYNGLSATETPITGNIVSLFDSNGFIIAQTQTTPAGTYQFTNVPNGTYTVGFATPNGLAPTIANAVGNASVSDTGDSDMNPNGQTNSFAVASADVTNVDAGFVATGSISGIVFGDTNGDGQDTDIDPTVYPNVTVSLLDANGTTIATTTTDINGAYTFDDVLPGNYTVVVDVTDTDLPPTATLSPQNIGNDATNSDIDAAGNAPVTVPIGTNVSDIDAGIVPPATYTLAGTVFVDDAGNGLQDNADAGLKGVTVFLFNANNLNDPVSVNITDDNGNYDFNNLPPGDYVVIVVKPTTYVFTDANVDPTNDIDDSDVTNISGNNGTTTPVTITDTNVDNLDAGLFVPATIQGIAFIDIDGDGFNDNGTVIPNLTVTLTNADGTPVTDANGATVTPTTTDATGNYQFTNLVPGDYIVTFGTPPAGYNYIPQSADSDINPATGSLPVTGLTSGEVAQVDGGAIEPATLSGTAFVDNNGNGLNDDAQAVANATVTLYNANGTPVATTATNTDGDYTFTNVLPGTYYVGFSNLPAGATIINPSTDSDALAATANTPNVTVVSGSNVNDGLDVGVIAPAAIDG